MTQEIEEIIKKNLPAQVGEILKSRLEQADRDSSTVKNQAEQIISKTATISGLEKTISDYRQFDSRNSALEAREKAVDQAERDLKVKTLEFQLASEKEKTEFTKSVALGLVRNTEYRRTLMDNVTTPMKDQYGNMTYPNSSQHSDETKKAE
jgi:phosphoribosyl-dephospho-CoA transferase